MIDHFQLITGNKTWKPTGVFPWVFHWDIYTGPNEATSIANKNSWECLITQFCQWQTSAKKWYLLPNSKLGSKQRLVWFPNPLAAGLFQSLMGTLSSKGRLDNYEDDSKFCLPTSKQGWLFVLCAKLLWQVFVHLEIDFTTFARVECAEDVLAKLFCISSREKSLVHITESGRSQLSIGTLLG